MTLPLIHTQHHAGSPASSDDSSLPPTTPVIDSLPINGSGNTSPTSAANAAKRKPSRRSNTAERRATHNAVERARRETLNSRFLDLASLLPNLSQIRRPSKSAIVNSSIALLQANERFRLLASKELRALKGESDALRRELNEWRDRSGVPRIEEPRRGDGFGIVLGGEVDSLGMGGFTLSPEEGYEDDEFPGEGYDEEMAQAQAHAHAQAQAQALHIARQQALAAQAAQAQIQQQQVPHPQSHGRPSIHIHPPGPVLSAGSPMVASPTQMAFENPAMQSPMYSHTHEFYTSNGMTNTGNPAMMPFAHAAPPPDEKMWFQQQQQQMIRIQQQQQQQQRTPPQSSHGLTPEMLGMRQRSASIGSMHSQHSHSSGVPSPPHHGGSPNLGLQVAQGVMV